MLGFKNLFQRFTKKEEPPSVALVPTRFFQVFREHGIEAAQIPRLIPKLRLDDLKSDDALLAVLDHDLLAQTAKLFGVRIEWLEGVDDVIYEYHSCYKQPEIFFETLAVLRWDYLRFPVRAITSDIKLDYKSGRRQPIALVFLDEIAQIGDETIYRYRVESGEWDWGHSPCRLQLKAMARLAFKKLGIVIPIFKVERDVLEAICENRMIPAAYLNGCLCSDPSLEDFGLTSQESGVAKETEEMPSVMQFIQDYDLENIANKYLHPVEDDNQKSDTPQPDKQKSEHARRAAEAKNEESNKLKQAFFDQYAAKIEAKEIGQAEAAREFYDSLDETQMRLLCRSSKDYENSTPDELRSSRSHAG